MAVSYVFSVLLHCYSKCVFLFHSLSTDKFDTLHSLDTLIQDKINIYQTI